jgi:hypothetical protein
LSGPQWSLVTHSEAARIQKIAKAGIPLREYVSNRLYRGITTGLNEAFVVDGPTREELIGADPSSEELIRPYTGGKGIGRWCIEPNDRWLIVTEIGVDMKRYPAIFKHLRQWREKLEKRQDQGNHWWELRPCTYYALFGKPKIVSTKVSIRPTFALDRVGHYLGNTAYFFPVSRDAYFLLGILNSRVFHTYAAKVFVEKQNGWWEVQPQGLEAFPIPVVVAAAMTEVEDLVKKCLDAKGEGCEAWEREIDERVAGLYGL